MKPYMLFCLLLCALHGAYAQQLQSTETVILTKPSWERVLSGKAAAQPERTSYGFIQMLDGRTLAACAPDGRTLWQQPLNGRPGSFLTVDAANDFCYALVNNNTKLQLYNPSGVWLWTVNLPQAAVHKPLVGRDGRVFVQGEQYISCYGVNGTQKWSADVPPSGGFPLYELPDGTLLYIRGEQAGGKTTALRISPFGSVLEELTFSGAVAAAGHTKAGVILVFADGAAGCCTVKNGMAYSQWIRSAVVEKPETCIILETGDVCSIISAAAGGSQALILQPETGETLGAVAELGPSAQAIVFTDCTNSFVTIADRAAAAAFNVQTKQVEWRASLPANKDWKYLLSTEPGMLVLAGSDTWTISAYRVRQYPQSRLVSDAPRAQKTSYLPFAQKEAEKSGVSYYLPASAAELAAIAELMQSGDAGGKELSAYLTVRHEADRLRDRYYRQTPLPAGENMIPSYASNIVQAEQLLTLFPLFESGAFAKDIAYAIKNETDSTLLAAAIRAASRLGYDPQGDMLSAIGGRIRTAAVLQNPALASAACDAVYRICRFMGKPAFLEQGREQLVFLIHPDFDEKIRASAESALKKLIDLQIQ